MHTTTHADLSSKKTLTQFKEIDGSRYTLEKKYGKKNYLLAYPYGRYNNLSIKVVNRLKIEACFTTEQQTVRADADVKMLGRFQVSNWSGKVFKNRLSSWML
jgi:peptidoglycan/xylan/chitin deacetylase (PgdA/CDA1 family)